MIVLLGSKALETRLGGLWRPCTDYDLLFEFEKDKDDFIKNSNATLISTKGNTEAYKVGNDIFELTVYNHRRSDARLLGYVEADPDTLWKDDLAIPSIEVLFTLKKSHRFKKNCPHFWKTFQDYHMLKAMGVTVPYKLEKLLQIREEETYNYSHPKLNVDKKDFFDGDQINYVYDHDWIHTVVARDSVPAYTHFLEGTVKVSKKKFLACDDQTKINSCVEESAVLAIERSLVPHPGAMTPEQAWRFALSKVLSSITSGWWREWCYENGPKILSSYPKGYWEKFTSIPETERKLHATKH